MNKLQQVFKKVINKHPLYAAQNKMPVTDVYSALKLKRQLIIAFSSDYNDEFVEKLAIVLQEHPEFNNKLLDVDFNEIDRAALANYLWDELGEKIELLFCEYLEAQRDIEDQRSREYREEAIEIHIDEGFEVEAMLDYRHRARDVNASMAMM